MMREQLPLPLAGWGAVGAAVGVVDAYSTVEEVTRSPLALGPVLLASHVHSVAVGPKAFLLMSVRRWLRAPRLCRVRPVPVLEQRPVVVGRQERRVGRGLGLELPLKKSTPVREQPAWYVLKPALWGRGEQYRAAVPLVHHGSSRPGGR